MGIEEPENASLRDELKALKAELNTHAKNTTCPTKLTHTTEQLQAVAELSSSIASIRNLQDLLTCAVDLICKRFCLSYVAIFMFDDNHTKARLASWVSGTDDITLPEKNYTFNVDDASIVRRSIEDGQARIAFYEGKKTALLKNHILPESRSEVLLPLMYHGHATGIMTMQSKKSAAFTFDDIPAYQIMADQISIAIENASLFEQMNFERDLLHNLMDTIPDSIYFKDKESRFIRSSLAMTKRMGLKNALEMVGKTDFDFFSNVHAQQAFGDEQKIIATGTPIVDIEEKETFANTNLVAWVSTTKMPLRDNNGTIMGTFGISRNITARKAAEEALEFRLNFEKHITSLSSQFITIEPKNIDNAIRSELQAMCDFSHTDRSCLYTFNADRNVLELTHEWVREGLHDFSHDFPVISAESLPTIFNAFKQLKPIACANACKIDYITDHEKATIKERKTSAMIYIPLGYNNNLMYAIGAEAVEGNSLWRHRTSDGDKWVNDSVTLITVIGELFLTALERKNNELLLEQEKELLRLLMDNIPDSIYFKDSESRYSRVNKAQAELMGISNPADAIGKTDFDFFPYAKKFFDDEQLIMRTGLSQIGKIEEVVTPDGSLSWYSATKIPLRNRERTTLGMLGVSRNITKLKEYEEALQKSNMLLEQRVEARTADIIKANQMLEQHIAQLNFLNTSFHSLSTIIQFKELLRALLNIFLMRFPHSQGSISVKSPNGLSCINATPQLHTDAGNAATTSLLHVLVPDGLKEPIALDVWQQDERLKSLNVPVDITLTGCMVIPLNIDNNTVVLIQLFVLPEHTQHYLNNRPVFSALEAHAALCLSNAVKFNELTEKSRLDGELDAARSIQRRFTPSTKPAIPNINIASVYTPANEVGGDYLDYFQTEHGHWVIVIADVCGKGVPAALLMTMLRSTFRVEAKHETSAKRLMCAVNDFMATNLDERSFVTALCLLIDSTSRTMTYARAGHPHLLKINAKEKKPENIACNGVALGLIADIDTFNAMTDEVTLSITAGERYIMYTDGVTEANNLSKNDYGLNRLEDVIAAHKTADADLLIKVITDDMEKFTRGAPQHDDITLLALEVT